MSDCGQTAVVTGGAGGIGKETARLLGKAGFAVVIADYNPEAGEAVCRELEKEHIPSLFVKTDVLSEDEIGHLFSRVMERFGRIDVLVNSAGISKLTKVPDITMEEWDLVLNINLRASFFCSQQALEYMVPRKKGCIINIASAAGKIGGVAVGAHYSASKAAIICLTKSLALYGAPYGINVNCVCPGPTATTMTDEWGDKINTEFAEKIPLKRYATTQEVAEVILFLCSEKTGYITGETVDVNGGLVMD